MLKKLYYLRIALRTYKFKTCRIAVADFNKITKISDLRLLAVTD